MLSSPDCSCHVHLLIYVSHACAGAACGSNNTPPQHICRRALTEGALVELPTGTGLPLIQMALLQLLPKWPCCIIIASCFAR